MRDYSTAGKRPRADTMPRRAAEKSDPLPVSPDLGEHSARANLGAHLMFGLPMNALGALIQDSGPKTAFRADGSRK